MRFVSFCPPLNRLGIECVSNTANLYIVIKHHCKLDELKTGFEIAKGYRVRHVPESNIQHTVGHGSLF